MKNLREYILGALVTGLIVIVPVYLAILLLLKAISRWGQGSKELIVAMERNGQREHM